MAIKLGELLIKKSLLTKPQLEEALQAQVIFGGKLGTILIEMGLISEDVLAEVLSQLLAVPCAKPRELEDIPEDIIKIISPDLAEKHKVIPVSVSGKKLTLAMAEPHKLQTIDDISFRTGYIIKPVLALEVRLVLALEEYYDVKRTMRYISPPRSSYDEQNPLNAFQPSAEPEEEPDMTEELGAPGSELIYEKPALNKSDLVQQEDDENIEELGEDALVEEVDEQISLASTAEALVRIKDRNDVAEAVIAYLGARFSRVALFMVVAGQVTGWRSAKDGQAIPGFDQFQLSLSEPSVLKTAVESKSFFLGPVPQNGANLAMITALGKPSPKTALLIPMSMLGRVVGLIYVDDATLDLSQAVADVQQISSKALMAFEILILHNKILRV